MTETTNGEQNNMTETTDGEQIEIWQEELAQVLADQQWRRALQLCSWLRYALWQQGRSDPEVEQAQRQAKEALAEQMTRERTQQERDAEYLRQQRQIMRRIISGDWEQAMDSIEVLFQDRTNRKAAVHLLDELKLRLGRRLDSQYRKMDQRLAALGRRFDELMEQVCGDLPINKR